MKNILEISTLKTGYCRENPVPGQPFTAMTEEGVLTAVIGKNGAGKTTLLKTLCGLLPALEGKIMINTREIGTMTHMEKARMISYIMPNTGMIPDIRVKDVISMGRFPYTGWFKPGQPQDHNACNEAIAQAGIEHLCEKQFHQLSEGEKQRVLFAMALAQNTPFMLFDEPAAFLDIPARNHIYDLMYQLTRKNHKSVIFTTHDIRRAMASCDMLWVFTPGGIIAGMPEELGINGVLDQVFQDDHLVFNNGLMDYIPATNTKGPAVEVIGAGSVFEWTFSLIQRLGFYPQCNITAPISVIVDETGKQWHIRSEKFTGSFFSCTEFAQQMKNLI